ncbi:MAG: Nudix family hydrolase [Thiogranum sp.]|nr:Nudix family hydrolase [Thiogranum sp.]
MSESTRNTAAESVPDGYVQVAVAAIVNDRHEVLISLRPDHVHQGGLWEFPGGKLETGEAVPDALRREIHEELGIVVHDMQPLIRIPHRYSDKAVLLDVWTVNAFEGTAHGQEGQRIEWVSVADLRERDFPEANKAIIHALQLPAEYLITPEPGADENRFLDQLCLALQSGTRLVQLRAKSHNEQQYITLARQAVALCHDFNARILLNADPTLVAALGADGVHLSAHRLRQCRRRPLGEEFWIAASCHGPEELDQAQRMGADFAVLSPVRATASHPQAETLGWPRFASWVDGCAIPVYALGGMTRSDADIARHHGAQGIAAIRALWET